MGCETNMVESVAQALLVLAFILGLGLAGPDLESNDIFAHGLLSGNSGLLHSQNQELTAPHIYPFTASIDLCDQCFHAGYPQVASPHEARPDLSSGDALSKTTFQETRDIASFLLDDEEIPVPEAVFRKRPADHSLAWKLSPFENKEAHGHRSKRISIANDLRNRSFPNPETFPIAEAPSAYLMPYENSSTKIRPQEPSQGSLRQAPSYAGGWSNYIDNQQDAQKYRPQILDRQFALDESNSIERVHPVWPPFETPSAMAPASTLARWDQDRNIIYSPTSLPIVSSDQAHIKDDKIELLLEDQTNEKEKFLKVKQTIGGKAIEETRMCLSNTDSILHPKSSPPERNESILENLKGPHSQEIDNAERMPCTQPSSFQVTNEPLRSENHLDSQKNKGNRKLDVKEVEMKLLAWISSFPNRMYKKEQKLMLETKVRILTAVKEAKPLGVISNHHHQGRSIEEIKNSWNESYRKLDQFLEHLWFLNSRFLKAFYFKPSNKNLRNEQREMFQWLLCKILTPDKSQEKHSSDFPNPESPMPIEFNMLENFVQCFMDCKDDGTLWEIDVGNHLSTIEDIRLPRIRMTEKAIEIIEKYYKMKNIKKWLYFFPDKDIFLLFMGGFPSLSIKEQSIDLFERKGSLEENPIYHNSVLKNVFSGENILPWSSLYVSRTPMPNFKFVKAMEEIVSFKKFITENTRLIEIESKLPKTEMYFYPRTESNHVYNRIAEMPQINSLHKRCAEFYNNICDKLQIVLRSFQGDIRLQNTVLQITKQAWLLNSRLLEHFGVESSSLEFNTEEESLEEWFLSLLGTCIQNANTLAHQSEILWKSIRNLSGVDNEGSYWNTVNQQRNSEIGEIILEGVNNYGTMITKVAVYVLGSFYKHRNGHKWFCVLKNDEGFLKILVQIVNKMLNNHAGHRKFWGKRRFQGIILFPWTERLCMENIKLEYLRRKVFGNKSYHKTALELVKKKL